VTWDFPGVQPPLPTCQRRHWELTPCPVSAQDKRDRWCGGNSLPMWKLDYCPKMIEPWPGWTGGNVCWQGCLLTRVRNPSQQIFFSSKDQGSEPWSTDILFSKRSKCPPRALQGAFYCGDYLDPDDLLEKRVFLFPIFLAMFLSIGETSSSVFYLSNYASFLKSATINSLEAGALTETNHLTLSLRRNEEEVRDVQSTESNCGWLITMTRV